MDKPNPLDLLIEHQAQIAAALESESLLDAVARLASLHPLEYEKVREAEAQRLGVRVGALDKEVSTARRSKQEDGGKAAMFPTVEPWHEPVNADQLLHEIYATVRRFIICEKETAITATLWSAFTWLVDSVEIAPLAVITAPEKRCGKSQLLNLIGKLSHRPLVAANIGAAAVFRVIEAHSPTLLIDEADSFFKDNEELRGVINSGHTRQSAYVIRCVGDDHEPRQFSTWGAKAISGIGHLAETLMDRSVILDLRRKLPSETIQRLRHAEPGLFDRLSSKLARFAQDAAPSIERARPALPEELNDRAQDNWEPLLAIADYAGGDWPQLARHTALRLSGAEQEAVSLSAELLADIREVFEHKRVERIGTADLLQALIDDDLKPWATYNRGKAMSPRQLAKRLDEYGIHSQSIKFGYSDVKRGFRLDQFADAFARYLAPETPPGSNPLPATFKHPQGFDGSGKVAATDSIRYQTEKVADENATCYLSATSKPLQTLEGSGVADSAGVSTDVEVSL